jgi:steroid delta-isomerase-like uncharacterized protein
MANDHPVELLNEWANAWSSPSQDRFLSLFTGDCVYEDVAAKHVMNGKTELAAFFTHAREAFPDFTVALTSSVAADGKAAIEWLMTGTHKGVLLGLPATNNQISMRGVSFIHIQDNRVARCTDYYDMAMMLTQLGIR